MLDAPQFENISQIKAANAALGHFWFEPATMRFFRSRVEGRAVYGGRYFITSERVPGDVNHNIPDGPRQFTIREANADGSIGTVGEFMGFAFLEDARASAKALARLARMATPDDCHTDGEAQARHERGTGDCASPFLYRPATHEHVIDPRGTSTSPFHN